MTRTWIDLAKAAGAQSNDEAEGLLWSGSAFPFVDARTVYYQIRHVVRHRVCYDVPDARCASVPITREQ